MEELLEKLYVTYGIHKMKKVHLMGLMKSLLFAGVETVGDGGDNTPEAKALAAANELGRQNYKFVELVLTVQHSLAVSGDAYQYEEPVEDIKDDEDNVILTVNQQIYHALQSFGLGEYIGMDGNNFTYPKIVPGVFEYSENNLIDYINRMLEVKHVASEIEVYAPFTFYSFETYVKLNS